MNPISQRKVAPLGTAIQVAADALMVLIESERQNAAVAAQDQLQKMQYPSHQCHHYSTSLRSADLPQFSGIQHQLYGTQSQVQQVYTEGTLQSQDTGLSVIPSWNYPQEPHADVDKITTEALNAQKEAVLVKRQLDELQAALKKIGISFCQEDNALRFEAGWGFVLSELENIEKESMDAEQLQEALGKLARRLQNDRDTIKRLEQEIAMSSDDWKKAASDYEMEIHSLKLEIEILNNAAESQSSQPPPQEPLGQDICEHPDSKSDVNISDLFGPPPVSQPPESQNAIRGDGDRCKRHLSPDLHVPTAKRQKSIDPYSDAFVSPKAENTASYGPRIDLRSVRPEGKRKNQVSPSSSRPSSEGQQSDNS